MKQSLIFLFVVLLAVFAASHSHAQFVSGSTGADGAFSPTANTVLQVPAGGVFNFTTVNVPSGVTVSFTKSTSNDPVTILAQGNVTIAGTINVNGAAGQSGNVPGGGGPGGFSGGMGNYPPEPGLGPGGGLPNSTGGAGGAGGGYGTAGGAGYGVAGPVYGEDRILPLIGGSGGGGYGSSVSVVYAGGGGGGAILIASSTTISVTGSILANGGICNGNAGGGSGGAIKLMANTVTATGTINALGGAGSGVGGVGRIRIEAYTANVPYGTSPMYTYGQPGSVVVSNTPTLRITSIGGASAPANPAGSFSSPDILLPSGTTNPVSIAVAASYIPVGTTVTIRVIPRTGTATSTTTTLSGVTESSTGTANVSISTTTTTVIMASATFTVAMNYEGEKIEKAVVRAYPGRESETTYITQSGREIKATEVMARNFAAQ
jgi:hypothetical protein